MSNSAFSPITTQVTTEVPTNVPVVEAWQSYTLTIGATTTAPTPGTIVVNEARWRRVGDSMEIYYSLRTTTAGSLGSGTYLFPLPSGYTADTTKMATAGAGSSGGISIVGAAAGERSSTLVSGAAILYDSSNIAIQVGTTGTATSLVGSSLYGLDAASKYTFRAMVPISQWAGSGTTTLATRAVEEYAFNTSGLTTAGGSNTTSFGYGPEGASIGSIASTTAGSNTTMRVRFQSTIQPTDTIILELDGGSGGTRWIPFSTFAPYMFQSTSRYGARLSQVNSTDIDVDFGNRGWSSANASYGGDGSAWSGISTYKWRVRKVSSGAQVGYPVSARNIIGDTSGTTVPTGMIGENYTALQSTNIAAGSSGSYKNVTSLQLTQGIWDVSYIGWVDGNGATGWVGTNSVCALSTTTASSAGTVNTTTLQYGTNGSVNNQVTSMRGNVIINISSTTTYYLNLSTTYTGGTPQLYGNIIARRIA